MDVKTRATALTVAGSLLVAVISSSWLANIITSRVLGAPQEDVDSIRQGVAEARGLLVPAGTIVPFAGALTEGTLKTLQSQGWLPCTGREVSKSTYRSLYNAIGETYGSSKSLDNFVLPDLQGE